MQLPNQEVLPTITQEEDNPMQDPVLEDDFSIARNTLRNVIEKGSQSLDIAIDILQGSEHPRAVETLAGLIKNLGEVSEKLVDLHKTKMQMQEISHKIKNGTLPEGTSITQNNTMMIGSTTQDIIKALASFEKGEQ